MSFSMILLICTLLAVFADVAVCRSTVPTVSFQLVGVQRHCPRDAGKKQFLLGWGDRTCAELASVGPQLLTNGSSLDFRSWDIQVVSGRVVRLVTHSPVNGNMLCSGGSLAVANAQSCTDARLTIATTPVQDLSDQFVMVPVPKNARSAAGEVYLVAKTRQRGCARLLSAIPGCRHGTLKLVKKDGGSGLQRWIRTKVVAPSPVTPSPSPSPTVSSPIPSPAPSPAPTISVMPFSSTSAGVSITPSGSQCSVSSYVVSYSIAGQTPQTMVVSASGKEQVVSLTGLMSDSIYSVDVKAVCSDGSFSETSANSVFRTFTACGAHGDACPLGSGTSCCSGLSCIDAMDLGYICIPTPSPPPSPPPPSPPPPSPPRPSPPPSPPYSGFIFTVVGNGTAGYASNVQGDALNYPYDVTFDTLGNMLIVDDHNWALRKVESNGSIITIAGNHTQGFSGDGGAPTTFELGYTHGATVDCQGNIYLADAGNAVIHKINTSGYSSIIVNANHQKGCSGDGGLAVNATLHYPDSVATDCSGNLYIVDNSCNTVRKVNASGYISTIAGNSTNSASGYSGDGGPATSAKFNGPFGIALDSIGNFYVSDRSNNVIRKIDAFGNISTVAGNHTLGGKYSGDGGLAVDASLNSPYGIALDTVGDLYVVDNGNSVIRKINTSGYISTVVGNYSLAGGYSGDEGPAVNAALSNPKAVKFDSFGNMYIADSGNNVIRKVYR